jgi:hypothetical protein
LIAACRSLTIGNTKAGSNGNCRVDGKKKLVVPKRRAVSPSYLSG